MIVVPIIIPPAAAILGLEVGLILWATGLTDAFWAAFWACVTAVGTSLVGAANSYFTARMTHDLDKLRMAEELRQIRRERESNRGHST